MDIFYNILNLKVGKNIGGYSDVIQSVEMKITVIGELGSSHSEIVTVSLSNPSDTFVSFDDITKDQVINWFKSAYYSDEKTEDSLIQQFKDIIENNRNTYNYSPMWN